MRVRGLEHGDLATLSEFIIDAYHDYPLATWFEEEPSVGQVEKIFYNKLRGVGTGNLVDVVTDDNGTIAGECEIVKISYDSGVIGIVVRHGYRKRNLGSDMLREAMEGAVGIGITKFTAEVAEENQDALKFFLRNRFMPIGYRNIEKSGRSMKLIILQHAI